MTRIMTGQNHGYYDQVSVVPAAEAVFSANYPGWVSIANMSGVNISLSGLEVHLAPANDGVSIFGSGAVPVLVLSNGSIVTSGSIYNWPSDYPDLRVAKALDAIVNTSGIKKIVDAIAISGSIPGVVLPVFAEISGVGITTSQLDVNDDRNSDALDAIVNSSGVKRITDAIAISGSIPGVNLPVFANISGVDITSSALDVNVDNFPSDYPNTRTGSALDAIVNSSGIKKISDAIAISGTLSVLNSFVEISGVTGGAHLPVFANISGMLPNVNLTTFTEISGVGITSNKLDVNINGQFVNISGVNISVSGLEVNLDAENDEVSIYGSGAGGLKQLLIGVDGTLVTSGVINNFPADFPDSGLLAALNDGVTITGGTIGVSGSVSVGSMPQVNVFANVSGGSLSISNVPLPAYCEISGGSITISNSSIGVSGITQKSALQTVRALSILSSGYTSGLAIYVADYGQATIYVDYDKSAETGMDMRLAFGETYDGDLAYETVISQSSGVVTCYTNTYQFTSTDVYRLEIEPCDTWMVIYSKANGVGDLGSGAITVKLGQR